MDKKILVLLVYASQNIAKISRGYNLNIRSTDLFRQKHLKEGRCQVLDMETQSHTNLSHNAALFTTQIQQCLCLGNGLEFIMPPICSCVGCSNVNIFSMKGNKIS